MSSVTFDALIASVGPDHPIRVISWKYDGKTEEQWHNEFYEPNTNNEVDPEFNMVFDYNLKPGVDKDFSNNVTNVCQWIEIYLSDVINRDEDQSWYAPDSLWDAGIFACKIRITGTRDYWGEYDEDHEFLNIVHITNMVDWDKFLTNDLNERHGDKSSINI